MKWNYTLVVMYTLAAVLFIIQDFRIITGAAEGSMKLNLGLTVLFVFAAIVYIDKCFIHKDDDK